MRFVIGGADSGKRDFVRENYGIDEILIADYDSVLTAKTARTLLRLLTRFRRKITI